MTSLAIDHQQIITQHLLVNRKNMKTFETSQSRYKTDKQNKFIERVQYILQWVLIIGLMVGLGLMFINAIK